LGGDFLLLVGTRGGNLWLPHKKPVSFDTPSFLTRSFEKEGGDE